MSKRTNRTNTKPPRGMGNPGPMDQWYDPRIPGWSILAALHSAVLRHKAACGLPIQKPTIEQFLQRYQHAIRTKDGMGRQFSVVYGCFVPCTIVEIPDDPHPWVLVNIQAFDSYYGERAAYRALREWKQQLAGTCAVSCQESDDRTEAEIDALETWLERARKWYPQLAPKPIPSARELQEKRKKELAEQWAALREQILRLDKDYRKKLPIPLGAPKVLPGFEGQEEPAWKRALKQRRQKN